MWLFSVITRWPFDLIKPAETDNQLVHVSFVCVDVRIYALVDA